MAKEVENIELTEDEKKSALLMQEDEILSGLLAAANYKVDESDFVPIEVTRAGKVLFAFRIHPLGEEEYNNARDKNTKYSRNRQVGMRMPEDVNTTRYRSELIYRATVAEDRAKVWDNKTAWRSLNVLNGIDLIDKVLKAGEKDAILEKLDQISGYQTTVEETAKN